jgi:hypothetical protein
LMRFADFKRIFPELSLHLFTLECALICMVTPRIFLKERGNKYKIDFERL